MRLPRILAFKTGLLYFSLTINIYPSPWLTSQNPQSGRCMPHKESLGTQEPTRTGPMASLGPSLDLRYAVASASFVPVVLCMHSCCNCRIICQQTAVSSHPLSCLHVLPSSAESAPPSKFLYRFLQKDTVIFKILSCYSYLFYKIHSLTLLNIMDRVFFLLLLYFTKAQG